MIFLYILIGLLGGFVGGMGMGGGTVLIPLLTLLLNVEQFTAQAINLIAFIPMAVVSLIIHFKNGLVKTEKLPLIIIPATISSILSSILASNTDAGALKSAFGVFLTVLGVISLICLLLKNSPREIK